MKMESRKQSSNLEVSRSALRRMEDLAWNAAATAPNAWDATAMAANAFGWVSGAATGTRTGAVIARCLAKAST